VYFLLDVSGESIVSGTEAGLFFIFVFAVLVFGTVALIFRYKPKPGRVD
jgi:membrane protein CcdC involved in cytochrome C biogenesis